MTAAPHEVRIDDVHRPTMKDVAALAGVGVKTVSRVVNQEPHVSEGVAARVLSAIATLGYERDMEAVNLRRKATRRSGR